VVAVSVIVFGIVFGFIAPIVGPPLGRGLEVFLTLVLTPPAWALEHLFNWIWGLFGNQPLNIEIAPLGEMEEGREAEEPSTGDPATEFAFRSFALLFAGGVAVLVIMLVTSLRKRGRTVAAAAPASSVAGSLGADLRGMFGSMFRRGGRKSAWKETEGISRLYREVLESSEERGKVRTQAQTPHEFAPVLNEVFHAPVTDEITFAFEQARYAGRPPDPRTLAELESRWKASRQDRG
jgi:hypothetical protein